MTMKQGFASTYFELAELAVKAEGEAVMKGMGNYTPYRRSTPSCAARSSSTSTTGASESWSDA